MYSEAVAYTAIIFQQNSVIAALHQELAEAQISGLMDSSIINQSTAYLRVIASFSSVVIEEHSQEVTK